MKRRAVKKKPVSKGIDFKGYYRRLAGNKGIRESTIKYLDRQLDVLDSRKTELLLALREENDPVKEMELKKVLAKMEFGKAEMGRIVNGRGKAPDLKADD